MLFSSDGHPRICASGRPPSGLADREREPEPPCPIYCSSCFPRKSPPACRRRRRRICAAWSPIGWSMPGSSMREPPRSRRRGASRSPCRAFRRARAILRRSAKGRGSALPTPPCRASSKAPGSRSLAEATIQKDPKRGDFYVALIERPGRAAIDVLAEILPLVIRTFPWPKSMRWGERSARPGALTWVRPLHSIVATFGPETEQPDIVPFAIDGIAAGDATHGHRFLAPRKFHVRHFEDYAAKLQKAKVVLDPARRKDIILADARHLAFAQGLELVEDPALLDEVAGLVEWPVTLMGSFDEAFLRLPPEVIRTTIRINQKCFVVRHRTKANMHPRSPTNSSWSPISKHRRRRRHHRRQRARDPRAAVGCEIFLRDRPEDAARRPAAKIPGHRVSRETRHPGGAHRTHRTIGGGACPAGRRRRGEDQARGAARQGGFAHRHGGRIPRVAGPDGEILRPRPGRGRERGGGLRRSLQAARTGGSRADRSGIGRGGAGG